MSDRTPGAATGLLASLTTLAATLVAIAHTRLELLSADLEEERAYQLSQLILILVTLFFLGVGVVLATMYLVAALWETHGLLTLGVLSAAFLAVGATTWVVLQRRARRKLPLFATSLAELLKDRQLLASRHE